MAAQLGSSILVQYGNQGAQQPGSSVILSYDQTAEAISTAVRSGTVGKWVKADRGIINLFSPLPGTVREDQSKDALWAAAKSLDNEESSAWAVASRADVGRSMPYGAFGEMLNEDRGSLWRESKATDGRRNAAWSIFGEMLNEDRGSIWWASKAIDAMRQADWRGNKVQTYRIVPYVRPGAGAANFNVVGGWPLEVQLPAGAMASYPLSIQLGAPTYIPIWLGDPLRSIELPAGDQANFQYKPVREPVVDGFGGPVFDKASRDVHRLSPWGVSAKRDRDTDHPWLKYSHPLNPGWGVVVPGGTPLPEPGGTIIIPILRAYIVVNEILLVRVADSTPITASQLSISFDCDSWLPSFSATIPEALRDAVMPDPSPVELFAYINGSEFRFLVEKVARSRAFAQRSVTISGRGVACELADPYAATTQHANASAMTAQQLIDASLEFTAYSQTWNITDWLVPADALSLYGTPAQVAGSVAEAAGAVLAADWALRDLRMLPRYPVKPWEWAAATPDYVIPSAVAQTESIEWVDKPGYNLVHVSGVQQGVLGRVKITGTAGDKPAPMVTHPLITHADAARQRGISILSDTGRKAMMQISMPVLESTGVIDICRLIEFSDGANTRRGIVRANSVSVNWPTVRQTLTVEAAA